MKKEKKQIAILLIAGGAFMLSVPKMHAQQLDTTKTLMINEVVITATRTEKNPLDVGRSTTVINKEKIKNSGTNTLAEVLSLQEGIYIVGNNQNPGQLQSIFCRGANSNQTSILIDGIKISDPSSADNGIDMTELSLANIERVEIVRGSHSTLYGSSAIGGVINIITRKNLTPGFHTNIEMKAGTFDSGISVLNENFLLNYTDKSGFYINAEAVNTNVNGLDATVDTVTNPNNYLHNHRDKDGFVKTDLIGKLGYKNNKWDVFVSYKNVGQKTDLDDRAYVDDNNYISSFKRNLFTYGTSYRINDKLNFSYIGGTTDLKRVFTNDSSVVSAAGIYDHSYSTSTYKADVFNNELQVNIKLKGFNVVAGGGYFNEKMTFSNYSYSQSFGSYEMNLDSLKINVKTFNQFAHIDVDGSIINDKWNIFRLGLGVRNTKHAIFGNNLTYEINPSLKINETGLLYAAYSTGFNAPSLYQLYAPDKYFLSGITLGNKTLKPETSASWELGFKQKVNENITYSISYFKTIVENNIDFVYLWNKNKEIDSLGFTDYMGYTYINIGKQTNQGVEIAISSKVTDKLWINGNLSLISGKLEYNPSNIDTTHTLDNHIQIYANGAFINKDVVSIGLVRRPSTANVGLTYKPAEKLLLGINLKYVGPRSDIYYNSTIWPSGALDNKVVADYSLIDLMISYKIFKEFTVRLKSENVFNVMYYEIYGYTTRGRSFYGSISYSF